MGHITVLVQHAWAMQPSTSKGKSASGITPAVVASDRRRGSRNASVTAANASGGHGAKVAAIASTTAAPAAAVDKDNTAIDKKSKLSLASRVRVTVPSSVAHLVRLYNACQTVAQRRTCEVAARDILARLEHLVLASTIPDTFRCDMIRMRIMYAGAVRSASFLVPPAPPTNMMMMATGATAASFQTRGSGYGYGVHGLAPLSATSAAAATRRVRSQVLPARAVAAAMNTPSTVAAAISTSAFNGSGPGQGSHSLSSTHHHQQQSESNSVTAKHSTSIKTRMFASEARLSVLMLARCRTRQIRDRAVDLLVEAIDTNLLATDNDEIQALQYLWSELVHVFRSVIDNRRRRRAVAGGLADAKSKHHMQSPSQSQTTSGVHNGLPTSHSHGRLSQRAPPNHAPSLRSSQVRASVGNHHQTPHRSDQDITNTILENALDTKVVVDLHLERILTSLLLTMQRLEFARDVRPFEFLPVMGESFELLMEDFHIIRSDDPYVLQLIATIEDSVQYMASSIEDTEEVMAFPIGVSLLSQIMRMMPPQNLVSVYESFHGIIADLNEKGKWHLGRKFIRILASAAMLHHDSCLQYIRFIHGLGKFNWHWHFLGILCLGAIACSSQSSSIRQIALEDGILRYIETDEAKTDHDDSVSGEVQSRTDASEVNNTIASSDAGRASSINSKPNADVHGQSQAHARGRDMNSVRSHNWQPSNADELDLSNKHSNAPREYKSTRTWIMRSAAINALIEIYQQYRTQPHGLLAREVMSNQRAHETHPFVRKLLSSPAAIAPQERAVRRISFLFKYTCMSLAEQYADSQSDYMYLRKYVRTAERDETRRREQKLKNSAAREYIGSGSWETTWDRGDKGQPSSLKHRCQSAEPIGGILYSQLNIDEPTRHSTWSIGKSQRSATIGGSFDDVARNGGVELSVKPYHSNYKQHPINEAKAEADGEKGGSESNKASNDSLEQHPDPDAIDPFEVYFAGWQPTQRGRVGDTSARGSDSALSPLSLPAHGSRLPGLDKHSGNSAYVQPDSGTVNRRKLFNAGRKHASPLAPLRTDGTKHGGLAPVGQKEVRHTKRAFDRSGSKSSSKFMQKSGSGAGNGTNSHGIPTHSITAGHASAAASITNATSGKDTQNTLRVVLPSTFEEIKEDEGEEDA